MQRRLPETWWDVIPLGHLVIYRGGQGLLVFVQGEVGTGLNIYEGYKRRDAAYLLEAPEWEPRLLVGTE